jgi:hypothetical protein
MGENQNCEECHTGHKGSTRFLINVSFEEETDRSMKPQEPVKIPEKLLQPPPPLTETRDISTRDSTLNVSADVG